MLRSQAMYYVCESPHKDRWTRVCVCDTVHRAALSGVNETESLDLALLGNRKVLLSEELNKEENPFCCCQTHEDE